MDAFDVIVIAIGYGLGVLDPPPSLRDTSASGGHEKVIFAVMIQALKRDWEEFLKSSDGRKDIRKRKSVIE